MSDTFEWSPLHPSLGARVEMAIPHDWTLEEILQLQALFRRRHLLVFPPCSLTTQEQALAVAVLAPPLVEPGDGVGLISNTRPDGDLGAGALSFHNDLAFSPAPYLGVSLHALESGPGASTTLFADGARAARELGPDLRRTVADRTALHVFPTDLTGRNRIEGLDASLPRYEHPVLMSDPMTGEEVLFVNEQQTSGIVGLGDDESASVLDALFRVLYSPENTYAHSWNQGDLVIWDNIAVQHGRPDVSAVGARTFQRITLAYRGFFEMYPQFKPVDFANAHADSRDDIVAAPLR